MNKDVSLWAPEEYWQLSDEQRRDLCNGCGTKGLGGYVVPDTIYGLRITVACDIHDFMYATGRSIEDKQTADRVFLNNMIRIIEAKTKRFFLRKLRTTRAYTYYLSVCNFGGPAFWSGKNSPREIGAVAIN
jgi:hypothetical protein